jgi:hypothetical protein
MPLRRGIGRRVAYSAPSSSAAPVFDPATMALTGWWRASYTGAPWVGTASAGASGTRDLPSGGSSDPSVGVAVNGFTPADFDGTEDFLAYATAADLVATNAGTIIVLFYADTAETAVGGQPFQSPCFWLNGGASSCVSYDSDGLKVGIYDTAWRTASVAAATGAWHLGVGQWNATNARVKVNGGAWQSVAAGAADGMTGAAQFGINYGANKFFNGRALERATSNTIIADADLDGFLTYARARYALALT